MAKKKTKKLTEIKSTMTSLGELMQEAMFSDGSSEKLDSDAVEEFSGMKAMLDSHDDKSDAFAASIYGKFDVPIGEDLEAHALLFGIVRNPDETDAELRARTAESLRFGTKTKGQFKPGFEITPKPPKPLDYTFTDELEKL